MGSVEVEDVEDVEGVAGARAASRWAVMGCGRGLGSADGAERTKIGTATANTSTSEESCGKLEASEGCSSIARACMIHAPPRRLPHPAIRPRTPTATFATFLTAGVFIPLVRCRD